MLKEKAVASLGQPSLLMPAWIKAALAANDRLKLYLTLLQSAAQHASTPDGPVGRWETDIAHAGLQDAPWAPEMLSGAFSSSATATRPPFCAAAGTWCASNLAAANRGA